MSYRRRGWAGLGPSLAAVLIWTLAGELMSCKQMDTGRERREEETAVAPSPPLPRDPMLQVVEFSNGVKFLSQAVPTNLQRVVLGLIVNVGSAAERDDERGIAHFVEHMAFAGTTHFPQRELLHFFDQVGLVVGGDLLGQTDYRFTSYLLELPANDPAVLARAVEILADWASGISFDPAAVEQERSVVLAEKRARNTPRGRLQEQQSQRWLSGSRFAERDPLGVEAVIESAPVERLASFYRRWYQPGNFTVVASGDFDVEVMRHSIEQHFASLPAAAKAETPPHFEVTVTPGDHFEIEADPAQRGLAVAVGLKRRAVGLVSEGDLRTRLTDELVSSLLQRRMQAVRALAGSPLLSVNVDLRWGEAGMFDSLQVQGSTAGAAGDALAVLVRELERVGQQGFSARELELGRRLLARKSAAEARQKRGLRQGALAAARQLVLGQAVLAPSQERELSARLLAGITPEEVNQHGQRWLRSAERHVLVAGHDAATLPNEDVLRAVVAQVKKEPIPPPVVEPDTPLMLAPPAPGAIVSEQSLGDLDAQVWMLANGARVVFKRMASEGGKISLRASSPGGVFRQSGAELVNATVSAFTVSQMGLGRSDAATTARLLSDAGVQLTPWISDYEEGVKGAAYVEGLEQLFQALHLTFAAPGHDAAGFELQRRRLRELWATRGADPDVFFQSEIDRAVWSAHPLYTQPAPEAADQLQLEPMRKFYLDRFGDVGDFTFVFVGDTTAASLRPLVERYLASLPGSSREDGAREAVARYHPGVTRVRAPGGAGDEKVRVFFHGDDPLPPSAWYDLDALSGYLELRLREVLREQLGAVYDVKVWFVLRDPPRQGYEMGFRFDCKAGQSEELKRAAFAGIGELKQHGVSQHYVDALRNQRARAAEGALQSAGFWLQELDDVYRRHRDPTLLLTEVSSTAHISSTALRRSALRFLRMGEYVDAVLEPTNSADAPPGQSKSVPSGPLGAPPRGH
ncbi:MAG: insulinase family protein [Deltaproteobacteria bacterium]